MDSLLLTSEVFFKIVINFSPILIPALVVGFMLGYAEKSK